ncbi:MAG: hypothetical protein IJX07_06285 [Bacillales bacterium]|nr:hypothetical protein [Bacillales bacterium]
METEVKKSEAVFTKEQILKSNQFKDRQDALSVSLEDGKTYTIKQVESVLKKFMARKVN